jgi:serine protease Do
LRQKSDKSSKRNPAYKHHGNYFVRLFHKARRSVISISTLKNEENDRVNPFLPFLFPRDTPSVLGMGSGFVIHRNGMILTSEHVVNKALQVTIKLYNGKQCAGRVIWSDPIHDIALIQTNPTISLPPLPLGSSRNSKVGELVMAIGNPMGLEYSTTTGVISGKNRPVVFSNSDKLFEDIIQTDCAINPGSSGGPLINLNGQVIGMNAFIASDNQGIGFAIGIDEIKKRIHRYLSKT